MAVSDEGEDYTDEEIDELYDRMLAALHAYDKKKGHNRATPKSLIIHAQVEWAGEFECPGGVRTARLGQVGGRNINLAPVREAMRLKSYNAKGWQAQLRQINRIKRGPAALAAAGFRVSRQTLRRWEAGTQKPSRANRERLQEAYDRMATPATVAPKAVQKLTDAISDTYGSVVRFRGIRTIKFDD
jgi:transcriptional regulator with XRE-family HTH domain